MLGKVVKTSWFEVDRVYLVFGDILRLKLELLGVGLFLTHSVLKPSLPVLTRGRDNQQVLVGRGEDPPAISRDLDTSDGVLETREQGLSILAEFLVKSNRAVRATNNQITSRTCRNRVKLRVDGVSFRSAHLILG